MNYSLENQAIIPFILTCLMFISAVTNVVRQGGTKQGQRGSWFFAGMTLIGIGLVLSTDSRFSTYANFYTITAATLILTINLVHYWIKNHINLPKHHLILSNALAISMGLGHTLDLHWGFKYLPVGMLGLLATVMLMVYAERLYYTNKLMQVGHVSLPFSIASIAFFFFGLFCYSLLKPGHESGFSQIISTAFIVIYPFLRKGILSLNRFKTNVRISRTMALHTAIFIVIGLYLIGLSSLAYFVGIANPDIPETPYIALFGASIFPLLYVISSTRIRSEILVWINKHFYASQFDYRATWRTITESFDNTLHSEEAAEKSLATLASLIGHPFNDYWRKKNGKWKMVSSTSELEGTIQYTSNGEFSTILIAIEKYLTSTKPSWIIDTSEAIHHPNRYERISDIVSCIETLEKWGVHWVIPVISENSIVGLWFVHGGDKPKWRLNWETRDFLTSISQQMEVYLKNQETQVRYQESAQLSAFHQTSAFVIHDVKNVVAQLSMLNKNATKHRGNPEFIDDAFSSLVTMEERLKKMLGQITNKQDIPSTNIGSSAWEDLCRSIVRECNIEKWGVAVEFKVSKNELNEKIVVDKEKLLNVIKHLIDNAQYASKEKKDNIVLVNFYHNNEYVIISVSDKGNGMSESFVKEKLFKPFETTKGNAGMGLGVYEAKQFCEQSGGHIQVDSEVDKGTVFSLYLPRSGND
jgi:putative PEP-CTERM system histidine kinase